MDDTEDEIALLPNSVVVQVDKPVRRGQLLVRQDDGTYTPLIGIPEGKVLTRHGLRADLRIVPQPPEEP